MTYKKIMDNKVKRIGYLPRKRVLEIIDEISKSESISRSKVVGILVEEALDARGIANFGYSNINNSNSFNTKIYKDTQNDNMHLKDAEDAQKSEDIMDSLQPDMCEVQAINHVISVIESRGLEKCSDKTKDAYKVLKDLSEKLSTDHVIYRP